MNGRGADRAFREPAAPAPAEKPTAAPTEESVRNSKTGEVLEEFAAQQQLASGAPLGEPELGHIPADAPEPYLLPPVRNPDGSVRHPGTRDPANYEINPAARSRVGQKARKEAFKELGEAVASGTDTPSTIPSREHLTPDQLLELTDPQVRAADPERARQTEKDVQAHHPDTVARNPWDADQPGHSELIPTPVHQAEHQGDTSRPLEMNTPLPPEKADPGFQILPDRKPSSTKSDRGVLQGARRDLEKARKASGGRSQKQYDEAEKWLADHMELLNASGTDNLPTPKPPTESAGEGATGTKAEPAVTKDVSASESVPPAAAESVRPQQPRRHPNRRRCRSLIRTDAPLAGGDPGRDRRAARELGVAFLPQLFGEESKEHPDPEAAHRARFTRDNQPAEGVERVNPHCHPAPRDPGPDRGDSQPDPQPAGRPGRGRAGGAAPGRPGRARGAEPGAHSADRGRHRGRDQRRPGP